MMMKSHLNHLLYFRKEGVLRRFFFLLMVAGKIQDDKAQT